MSQRPDPLGPSYQFPAPPPPDPTGWHRLRDTARGHLWPPGPTTWAGLLALLVAAAGILGLWFQATLPARLPTSTDWAAAAAVIARDARPGDAVALAPAWAERAREVLPERVPASPGVPLPVLALPSYAEPDAPLDGIRRVWLLALPDVPGGPGRAAAELAGRAASVEPPLRIGQLEVSLFPLRTPSLPLWRLADRVPAARSGTAPGPVRAVREVGFLPRDCVVVSFPGPTPEPVSLRVEDAPLGSGLRGRVGLVGLPAPGAASGQKRAWGPRPRRRPPRPARCPRTAR